MSENEAEEIIGWKYPGEYAFYDMERDVEDMAELRAAHVREEKYHSVFSGDELIGFFEFSVAEDGVEIGLGLRPDLTGTGIGSSFLEAAWTVLVNASVLRASSCAWLPSTRERSRSTRGPASCGT